MNVEEWATTCMYWCFGIFGAGVVIAIVACIIDKWLVERDRKRARQLPNYMRAYDRKGNRIQ